MILRKLQIRNFRRNKRLDVVLDRVTVFRGPSGSGKSSLIGALKWVTINQPSGTSFIHWGRKRTAVRLRLDKNSIIRTRTDRQNTYHLNDQRFAAFGAGVPAPIAKLLNMGVLNFQRQHAGPFWFRETAGEVSRQLNAIVNLELIDKTLANLGKKQRETKVRLQDVESRIETARGEKRRFAYVRAVESRLRTLNATIEAQKAGRKRAERLSALIEQAKELDVLRSRSTPNIRPLLTLCKKYRKGREQYEKLAALFGTAENYEEGMVQLQVALQNNQRNLKRIMGKRCPLCGNPIRQKT